MCRTEYLYGCVHIGVQATMTGKNGKVPDWQYFEESRLEEMKSDHNHASTRTAKS